MPVLLYGLEILNLAESERSKLDFIYSTVFLKRFFVKDSTNIKLCQYYSGCLPPSCRLDIKKFGFFNGLQNFKDSMPLQLVLLGGKDDLLSLVFKYSLLPYDRGFLAKCKVFK